MADEKTNPDKQEAEKEAHKNADKIKDVDRTDDGPRGNVYSKAEDVAAPSDGPPPLPN